MLLHKLLAIISKRPQSLVAGMDIFVSTKDPRSRQTNLRLISTLVVRVRVRVRCSTVHTHIRTLEVRYPSQFEAFSHGAAVFLAAAKKPTPIARIAI